MFVLADSEAWAQAEWRPNASLSLQQLNARLGSHSDTIWVVDFWASWCAPCIQAMLELKASYPNLQAQRVVVLSISVDAQAEDYAYMLHRVQPQWPQLHIPNVAADARLAETFKFRGIPAVFIIDHKGNIAEVNLWWQLERDLARTIKRRDAAGQ